MSIEIIKKSVDFILENTIDDEVVFNFFGGEPLLCFENIKEAVKYIKKRNETINKKITFTVTTNGTIINQEIKDYLVENNFGITLSLDGNEYSQNKHRKTIDGKGSYFLVKDKIPHWLDVQKRSLRVSVRMTIDTGNVDGLYNSVNDLCDMGFKRIVFTPNAHDGWTEEDILVLKDEYRKISELYIRKLEEGNPFSCSNIEKYITRKIKQTIPGCSIINSRLAISVTGKLYPCHRFVREDDDENVIIGDIFSGFDKRKDEFLEKYDRVKGCSDCVLFIRCGNQCLAVNYNASGDISNKHWFTCENERISIEISDFVGSFLFKNCYDNFLSHLLGPKKDKTMTCNS